MADVITDNIDLESIAKATPVHRPFADLCQRVLERADVQDSLAARQVASHVCGANGLSAVPEIEDDEEFIELQAARLAQLAEEAIERAQAQKSPIILTPMAKKIARAAIMMRIEEAVFRPEPELTREERAERARAEYAKRRASN